MNNRQSAWYSCLLMAAIWLTLSIAYDKDKYLIISNMFIAAMFVISSMKPDTKNRINNDK